MAEEDTWENRENLENIEKLVKEFEGEYGEEAKELRRQEQKAEEKESSRELPRKFMANYYMARRKGSMREREEKEMGQKLELMEKFLETRKLEEGAML